MRIDSMSSARDESSFGADIVPAQFYSGRRRAASLEPVLRLMSGVLADAVRCFQRNFDSRYPNRRKQFREAKFWIFDDRSDGPFSFQGVCAALEIDPRRLRNLIVRWEKEQRASDKRQIQRAPDKIAV